VQYTEQTNGREVEVKAGEELEIVLPEVRTAGYRWNIVQNGAPQLQLVQDDSQPNAARVGGARQHRWRFGAVAAGASEIKIEYARSWEESAQPARTFILKVRVQS
jgi:predicted secreted protein